MSHAPIFMQIAGSIFFICAGIAMCALSIGMTLLVYKEYMEYRDKK